MGRWKRGSYSFFFLFHYLISDLHTACWLNELFVQVGSKDQLEKERCNNESIEKPIISRYLFSYPRLIFRFIFLINGFKKLLYRNENNGLSLLKNTQRR